jgi:hypothetical protein
MGKNNLTARRTGQSTMDGNNFLGIRGAKHCAVHLADPRVTKDRRRRWTGFAAALTVTFTVCDAQQIGLSPSGPGISKNVFEVAVRTSRDEQKAPPQLGPLPTSNQAETSRLSVAATAACAPARTFGRENLAITFGLNELGGAPGSEQNTRGPPL